MNEHTRLRSAEAARVGFKGRGSWARDSSRDEVAQLQPAHAMTELEHFTGEGRALRGAAGDAALASSYALLANAWACSVHVHARRPAAHMYMSALFKRSFSRTTTGTLRE